MKLGLYPILDVGPSLAPEDVGPLALAYLAGGARRLQLRAKTLPARDFLALAVSLRPTLKSAGAKLIINDRPDLAVLAGADGVHLGQEDLPAEVVRPWLPAGMILGVSCHNLEQLEAAARLGVADYAGYGPIFETRSKANPDPVVGLAGLAEAVRRFPELPLVAIGGLSRSNLRAVAATSVAGAALIADLRAGPDPRSACEEAIARFTEGAP